MLKRLPLLIAVLALSIWLGNFIIRNFLAASLIAYGEDAASREQALAYAPSNPPVVAARAKYWLYRAEPARTEEALAELERAAALSPRDYRFHLELGRAYDNTGDAARAEASLRRAVELAPRYFDARWALANFLLRAGKPDTAIEEFRLAMGLSGRDRPDEKAALNIYNAVAGATDGDLDRLRRITAEDHFSQSLLARFLVTRESLDAALGIWRGLPASDRESNWTLSAELVRALQGRERFADALEVWRRIEWLAGFARNSGSNLMRNSGFEERPAGELHPELAEPPAGFDWIVRRHPEVPVRRTSYEHHEGANALHLALAASMNSEFNHIAQLVAVEPGATYRFSYFVKMRNVPSDPDRAPFVELADAVRAERFNLRSVLPGGGSEWQEQTIGFTLPAQTRGLHVRIRQPRIITVDLARVAEVWFDDFKLEKANP
jgi:tetratricopeptide (TPR) repeat protein